jgi:hypothetical protein
MKIGILTYHRVYNYGATLQAVALRIFLENRGHHVSYVDYYPEYHKKMYRAFNLSGFWKKNMYEKMYCLYDNFRQFRSRKERMKVYDDFLSKYILPYCSNDADEHYDAIIYGSDQIWRKQPGLDLRYNPVYFGSNDFVCDRRVSYAASMGNTNINEEDASFIKEHLSNFSAVGVRERDLYDVLKPYKLRNLSMNADPTLLLDEGDWDNALYTERLIKDPYALFYKVRDSFSDDVLRKYCSAKRLKLVKVNPYNAPLGSDCNPNPAELVSLIKYADVVLTSSFHGLAFSIVYQKEVFVSSRSNTARMSSLMQSIGVEGRLLPFGSPIPIDASPIDYLKVKNKLAEVKRESEEFLQNTLEN